MRYPPPATPTPTAKSLWSWENGLLLHKNLIYVPHDVGVFSSVKSNLTSAIKRFIGTGIARLQKAEWPQSYVKARATAVSKYNIDSG